MEYGNADAPQVNEEFFNKEESLREALTGENPLWNLEEANCEREQEVSRKEQIISIKQQIQELQKRYEILIAEENEEKRASKALIAQNLLNTQETFFKWFEFSPLLCDEHGCYPLIDWTKCGKVEDSKKRWKQITTKKADPTLEMPLLILPSDFGGWMVCLYLQWDGMDFSLYGCLPPVDHNKDAPGSISVPMSLELEIKGDVTFSKHADFIFKKETKNAEDGDGYDHLWLLSTDIDNVNWPMPTLKVAVKEICSNVAYCSEKSKLAANENDKCKRSPPFGWPTPEMMNVQRTFISGEGFSPMQCNEWGRYPLIDWEIYGNAVWKEQWMELTKKNAVPHLQLPPLLLPSDLGGWMVEFFLKWDGFFFYLRCGIVPGDYNKHAPESIPVPMSMELQIKGHVTYAKQCDIVFFRPTKNETGNYVYKDVWLISTDVDTNWPMPTMMVTVDRLNSKTSVHSEENVSRLEAKHDSTT